MSSRPTISPGDGDPRHGTYNGYTNLSCRCPRCRKANAVERARATAARAEKEVPEHVHGTPGGYGNWMCRCKRCRKANTESKEQQRQARKARDNA